MPDLKSVPDRALTRSKFLSVTIKLMVAGVFIVELPACKDTGTIPVLKGLSREEYNNIKLIGEFFLKDYPVRNFDIGIALDKLLYGAANPHPSAGLISELIAVPSSFLASLVIDNSFIPLSQMNREERYQRLIKWKTLRGSLARGVYSLMHGICMLLLSSDPAFVKLTGYPK